MLLAGLIIPVSANTFDDEQRPLPTYAIVTVNFNNLLLNCESAEIGVRVITLERDDTYWMPVNATGTYAFQIGGPSATGSVKPLLSYSSCEDSFGPIASTIHTGSWDAGDELHVNLLYWPNLD